MQEKYEQTNKHLDQTTNLNKSSFGSEPKIFEKLLSYKEAAQYLSMSESYLRRLKSKGKIPFVSISKRGVRFRVASLNVWIAEREVK